MLLAASSARTARATAAAGAGERLSRVIVGGSVRVHPFFFSIFGNGHLRSGGQPASQPSASSLARAGGMVQCDLVKKQTQTNFSCSFREGPPLFSFPSQDLRPVVVVDACFTKDWLLEEAATTTMRRYPVPPPFPPFRILVYLRNAPSALPFLYIIMYMCIVRQPRHKKVRSGGSIYGLYKSSKMPTNPQKESQRQKRRL